MQRPSVRHHRLDAARVHRAGELLRLRLASPDHGHGEPLLGQLRIAVEHGRDLGLRFLGGLVKGVPLLPQELRRAQKQPGAHLPATHVAPLVDLHRQVTPRVDPVRVHGADDGLARGPDGEPFVQLLAAAVRHPGHLGRKALDVLRLLLQIRLGYQQREVHVLVPGTLEHVVERTLDVLPECKAIRTDDHAAAHRRIVGELCAAHDVDVPAVEIVGLPRYRLRIGAPRLSHRRPSVRKRGLASCAVLAGRDR